MVQTNINAPNCDIRDASSQRRFARPFAAWGERSPSAFSRTLHGTFLSILSASDACPCETFLSWNPLSVFGVTDVLGKGYFLVQKISGEKQKRVLHQCVYKKRFALERNLRKVDIVNISSHQIRFKISDTKLVL